MSFWALYITICMVTIPIEEKWNIDNPRPKPNREYLLCNWNKDDFYPVTVEDKWLLREYGPHDNKYKAKIRGNIWNK